jgi:hypothetical protein
MTPSPIRSRAQHTMLTRAATDEAYAAERGITVSAAKALLDEHAKAGNPDLPERAGSEKSTSPRAPKRHKFKLLGAH